MLQQKGETRFTLGMFMEFDGRLKSMGFGQTTVNGRPQWVGLQLRTDQAGERRVVLG